MSHRGIFFGGASADFYGILHGGSPSFTWGVPCKINYLPIIYMGGKVLDSFWRSWVLFVRSRFFFLRMFDASQAPFGALGRSLDALGHLEKCSWRHLA